MKEERGVGEGERGKGSTYAGCPLVDFLRREDSGRELQQVSVKLQAKEVNTDTTEHNTSQGLNLYRERSVLTTTLALL